MHDSSSQNHKYTNALINETSPYLLQHAHNPVQWYPWGDDALEKARKEDKPIFLSIGYSACHWCHVMERESFENEAIAAILNQHFVSIKIDREERPDLDEIYMSATVAQSGSGGWPMSVFITPDLKPFFCGTYFPPENWHGRPGFTAVLNHIISIWNDQREDVLKTAEIMTEYLSRHHVSQNTNAGDIDDRPLVAAVQQLQENYDAATGGWGNAPKFPASATISLLLRMYSTGAGEHLLDMATHTLDCMALGGIYDQLGGGFHRYSVDDQWLVPHFEKMLYDNAQLADVYIEAYQLTGTELYKRIAIETLDYVLHDMRHPDGPFFSAEDADSEGQEGSFYVWTLEEIQNILGMDASELFCRIYNVQADGNFSSHEPYHSKKNILHLQQSFYEHAENLGITEENLRSKIKDMQNKLLSFRVNRVRPGLDDKILTSWNGLMISALSKGARVLQNPKYSNAAADAADFIWKHMRRDDGTLLRTHRGGKSHLEGYLDDYAFYGLGPLDLYETTLETHWLDKSIEVAENMLAQFVDNDRASFYFTAPTHKHLLVRTRPTFDGAEPSGNSMAASLLYRLGRLIDHSDWVALSQRVIEKQYELLIQAPTAFCRMLCLLHTLLQTPLEIALLGPRESDTLQAMVDVVSKFFIPHRQLARVDAAEAETLNRFHWIPDASINNGEAEARVCHNYVCDLPVNTPEALHALLAAIGKNR